MGTKVSDINACSDCVRTMPLDFDNKYITVSGYYQTCTICLRRYGNPSDNFKKLHKIFKTKNRRKHLGKLWRKNNPDRVRFASAKRRSQKLNATPSWISQLEIQQIKSIYKQAIDLELATGIPHHVDHLIPLIHPLVCGFHCFSNLRVITAKENLIKGNKFTPFVESDLDTNH